MASSWKISTSSAASSDLAHQSPLHSVDRSTNIDENPLYKVQNFYGQSPIHVTGDGTREKEVDFLKQEQEPVRRTAGEVWEEISRTGNVEFQLESPNKVEFDEITLEDFLTRTGMPTENKLQAQLVQSVPKFSDDSSGRNPCFIGKRNMSPDSLEGSSQQKQKRMIKNRESAARSRERKQAYVQQLEMVIARLEEERVVLLEEQAQRNKLRLKHLMKNLTPVAEKKRSPPPPRPRRTRSC